MDFECFKPIQHAFFCGRFRLRNWAFMGLVWFSDGIGKKVAFTNLLAEARCNNHRFSDLKVTLFLEGHICFFVSETLPTLHWGVGVGTRWAIKSTSEPFSVGRVGRKGILQQKRVGLAFRNEIQAWWNIFHANLRAHPPLKQGPNKAYLRPTMLVFPIPK